MLISLPLHTCRSFILVIGTLTPAHLVDERLPIHRLYRGVGITCCSDLPIIRKAKQKKRKEKVKSELLLSVKPLSASGSLLTCAFWRSTCTCIYSAPATIGNSSRYEINAPCSD